MAAETFNNKNHPERRSGEIFVGNSNNYGFENIGWKTKRKGDKAFYSFGKEYADQSYFPVFASEEEVKKQNSEVWARLRYAEAS